MRRFEENIERLKSAEEIINKCKTELSLHQYKLNDLNREMDILVGDVFSKFQCNPEDLENKIKSDEKELEQEVDKLFIAVSKFENKN